MWTYQTRQYCVLRLQDSKTCRNFTRIIRLPDIQNAFTPHLSEFTDSKCQMALLILHKITIIIAKLPSNISIIHWYLQTSRPAVPSSWSWNPFSHICVILVLFYDEKKARVNNLMTWCGSSNRVWLKRCRIQNGLNAWYYRSNCFMLEPDILLSMYMTRGCLSYLCYTCSDL